MCCTENAIAHIQQCQQSFSSCSDWLIEIQINSMVGDFVGTYCLMSTPNCDIKVRNGGPHVYSGYGPICTQRETSVRQSSGSEAFKNLSCDFSCLHIQMPVQGIARSIGDIFLTLIHHIKSQKENLGSHIAEYTDQRKAANMLKFICE